MSEKSIARFKIEAFILTKKIYSLLDTANMTDFVLTICTDFKKWGVFLTFAKKFETKCTYVPKYFFIN